jgi:hypothetical protein
MHKPLSLSLFFQNARIKKKTSFQSEEGNKVQEEHMFLLLTCGEGVWGRDFCLGVVLEC